MSVGQELLHKDASRLIKIAHSLATEWPGRFHADLVGVGLLAACEAADSYRPARSNFRTYMRLKMWAGMVGWIRDRPEYRRARGPVITLVSLDATSMWADDPEEWEIADPGATPEEYVVDRMQAEWLLDQVYALPRHEAMALTVPGKLTAATYDVSESRVSHYRASGRRRLAHLIAAAA